MFAQEQDKAIAEKVRKLQDAEFIKEVYYPYWLANECSDGQESQRKVENEFK